MMLLAAAPATMAGSSSLLGLGGVGTSNGSLSIPVQIIVLLTLLTLLPAALMSITPFLRITIVLHFLRQALGTQTAPSNQVLLGVALFMTILIMQPVAADIYHKAWEPVQKNEMTLDQGFDAGSQPLKTFLARFAREKDVRLFVETTRAAKPRTAADLDLKVLIPAYILSELKAGFQIGAVLF